MSVAVRWAASAGKHGVDRADALHAIEQYLYRVSSFQPARDDQTPPDLYIGPTRDGSALLEVLLVNEPPGDLLIFHVMPARPNLVRSAERRAR